MSQEKVDRYKQEKANRKKIVKKQRIDVYKRQAGGREVAGSNPVTPIFYIYYRKEHVESISVITQNAFFV